MMRSLATGLVLALLLAACGQGPGGNDDPTVVATTTILGDVARNIVGFDADVAVLLPIGADPHAFQLSARQVALINEADLVVANGLSLEGFMADVLDVAKASGVNVLEVAPQLEPIPFGAGDDPHVWMDPVRMKEAARLIAAELSSIDDSIDWAGRANLYGEKLLDADKEIQWLLSGVAEADRKLVTNHDALGYFADRYNFAIVGTVILGGATLADPSSAELAGLVATMKAEGVKVIFAETTESTTLAETVAGEMGVDVLVVELFTGSLGEPGSGAETFIEMLLTNAKQIAGALGS